MGRLSWILWVGPRHTTRVRIKKGDTRRAKREEAYVRTEVGEKGQCDVQPGAKEEASGRWKRKVETPPEPPEGASPMTPSS